MGKLLDAGIQDLLWIDKDFRAGNFSHFREVPSNTKIKFFTQFFLACKSFGVDPVDHKFFGLVQEGNCTLGAVTDLLQIVTDRLKKKVAHVRTTVQNISEIDGRWRLELENQNTYCRNVVLATGGLQKTNKGIPLEKVLNLSECKKEFNEKDCVAVVGSSHSAILAIKNLLEVPVAAVVNLYRHPIRFAVPMEDGILFDDTGLKGEVAEWARDHLVCRTPKNVSRYYTTDIAKSGVPSRCNKVVYATGYEPNRIDIKELPDHSYDPHTGIIAPGLFGVGLAYPEQHRSKWGHEESRVGLWKFMDYLNRVVPIWVRYGG